MDHQTSEYASFVSHGLAEHFHKFTIVHSMSVYLHFLFYSRKTGSEKGTCVFTLEEIGKLIVSPEEHEGHKPKIARQVLRIIYFLQKIEMIDITKKGTTRYDNTWKVRVRKFKTLPSDFGMVFKVTNKESISSPVTSRNPESADSDEFIWSHKTNRNGTCAGTISPVEPKQLELWDKETEEARLGLDSVSSSHTGLDHSQHKPPVTPDLDWMLEVPGPVSLLACVCNNNKRLNTSRIYEFFKSQKDKKVQRLVKYIEEKSKTGPKSSEELINPVSAIGIVKDLQKKIEKVSAKSDEGQLYVRARNEFFMLYWNGILVDGKPAFGNVKEWSALRREKLRVQFSKKVFLDNWATAAVRMKGSKYCLGKLPSSTWKAHFDWFTKSENQVIKILEGLYDDRFQQHPQSRKRARRQVKQDSYLKGLPLKGVADEDLDEWIEANPDLARQARETGLLQMRLGDESETESGL